jgi:hypothetical protein
MFSRIPLKPGMTASIMLPSVSNIFSVSALVVPWSVLFVGPMQLTYPIFFIGGLFFFNI